MQRSAPESRHLIVNADDFGLTSGINRGIIEAHEHGIVTSASLMVRYEAAADAADYAKLRQELSLGLHFEAAEWRYRSGEWYAAYEVVDAHDAIALQAELDRQLEQFERLTGRLPTHLDSHQHVHQTEPARSILLRCAERLGVPLRGCHSSIAYDGGFYGQTGEGQPHPAGISMQTLTAMIAALPAGWTELGCHPGYVTGLDSVYLHEREEELRVLCSPEIKATLKSARVPLHSFQQFRP